MNAPTQFPLRLIKRPEAVEVPIELIRAKKTQGAAFTLACDACTNKEDKELADELDIDSGTWSRMKKGANTLPGDLLARFCEAVGNHIYSEWLAYQTGHTLVLIKSEAERQRDEAEQRAKNAEAQVELLKGLIYGRATA